MKYISIGLSAAVSLGMAAPAFAQNATTNTPAAAAAGSADVSSQMQQVVVTGTHQSNRTVAESLAPITVISAAELTSGGYSDIGSSLNALMPSINFPRQNQGAASIQRPMLLRGLSPNHVVVLVDGVRYHTSSTVNLNADIARGSAPVDINSIPMASVDHIEVLSDGASAQYGSDAIAGVVNIVLKRGFKKGDNSAAFEFGKTNAGDGIRRGASANFGMDIGNEAHPGWARVSLSYQDLGGTNRAGLGTQTSASAAAAGGYAYQYHGDSPEKNTQGSFNFESALTPDVKLYGSIIGSHRKDVTYGFYRVAGDVRNIASIYPNGYLPEQVPVSTDVQTTLGLKGVVGDGWRWKTYLNFGQNKVGLSAENTLNVAYYRTNGSTPTSFYLGNYKSTDAQANFELGKDFDVSWFKSPLSVTYGLEARREGYSIGAGVPSSYYGDAIGSPAGAQVRTGTPPDQTGKWSRESLNTYLDAETDLTDKLSAGLAGRYEHYNNGVGATRSGKLSLRYQAFDTLAFRGTVSNGFRAPSLAQQHYQSINTSISGQQLVQSGTYAVDSAAAKALGATALRPEKSTNFSAGIVWQPVKNVDVTLDAYKIKIRDQILYTDRISMPAGSALANYFNSQVPGQQVTAAQFFTNAGSTQTTGVDLITNWRKDLASYGKINLSASANYNKTKILAINANSSVVQQYAPSALLFGPGSQALLTDASPTTKFSFTANWDIGQWDVIVSETRYGSVVRYPASYPYANGVVPQKYDARWITNLAVSYKHNAWTYTVGADNLFNQYPTRVASNNDQYLKDEIPYDTGLSPFGSNGGYYYVKANFAF
jgi:iron complex outermembrane receptor protein